MSDFLQTCLTFPTLLYSIVLAFCAIYWLLASTGLVDTDAIDGEQGPLCKKAQPGIEGNGPLPGVAPHQVIPLPACLFQPEAKQRAAEPCALVRRCGGHAAQPKRHQPSRKGVALGDEGCYCTKLPVGLHAEMETAWGMVPGPLHLRQGLPGPQYLLPQHVGFPGRNKADLHHWKTCQIRSGSCWLNARAAIHGMGARPGSAPRSAAWRPQPHRQWGRAPPKWQPRRPCTPT